MKTVYEIAALAGVGLMGVAVTQNIHDLFAFGALVGVIAALLARKG